MLSPDCAAMMMFEFRWEESQSSLTIPDNNKEWYNGASGTRWQTTWEVETSSPRFSHSSREKLRAAPSRPSSPLKAQQRAAKRNENKHSLSLSDTKFYCLALLHVLNIFSWLSIFAFWLVDSTLDGCGCQWQAIASVERLSETFAAAVN